MPAAIPDDFRAYRVSQEEAGPRGRMVTTSLDELDPGDVVIRARYSSVNYKDALAAMGAGKVMRRLPLVGGIDVAGEVASSASPELREGDRVLVTGYGLGEDHDGGYSEYVRVPAGWMVPVPEGLGLWEAMALGTAGFTAGLAIHRLEHEGLSPSAGPVVVPGATGGLGSVAVSALARLGYEVVAISGKREQAGYLEELGASSVLWRDELEMGTRPLEKGTWAGAVDPVGGETLAWLTRTTNRGGAIASCGLAGGTELHTTVMPFILRGVSLLGIDSVACPMDLRRRVWERLASDMRPPKLDVIARSVAFEDLPRTLDTFLSSPRVGRIVVEIAR